MEVPQTTSQDLLVEFCEEAMDLLQDLPEELAQFAADATDTEAINVVFRAVHTVKGNAGFFGLTDLKEFAHSLEDALDEVRQGIVPLSEDLTRNLVQGIDSLGDMIIQIETGTQNDSNDAVYAELLSEIHKLCDETRTCSEEEKLLVQVLKIAEEMAVSEIQETINWSDRLRKAAGSSEAAKENGAGEQESEVAVDSLAGACFECGGTDVTDQVAPLVNLFVAVQTKTYHRDDGEQFIHNLDEFAKWAQLEHPELASLVHAAGEDYATIFSSSLETDEMLLSIVWQRLAPALVKMCKGSPPVAAKEESPDETKPETNATENGAKKNGSDKGGEKKGPAKNRFLRVREERVDGFLDDVSRLFITCERLKDLQLRMAGMWHANEMVDELRQINGTLSGQSTILQRSVVELRKVPVGGLFSKFPRVARSLASKLGKQLDVHVSGEDIEIDKSLLEDLDGPLMHMVRNVCDHGIDTPAEREARGVSPVGTLRMECSLSKTHVIITVADDGRGIDPVCLRKKCVEKGVLTAEDAAGLSDQEAVELIFAPGFSTAEEVSEVSGRGVGLDVVRTRLREHNGDVMVSSTLGKGTTFRLEIPIRKAVVVVDGLLVQQHNATFVIPFDHIQEILRLDRSELSSVQGRKVARVRGEPYAAVTLSELLEIDDAVTNGDPPLEGVLINGEESTMLLLVDSVLGQRKVVVSDLAAVLPDCDRISGVAQLGGGQLALVLNSQELIRATGRIGSGE